MDIANETVSSKELVKTKHISRTIRSTEEAKRVSVRVTGFMFSRGGLGEKGSGSLT